MNGITHGFCYWCIEAIEGLRAHDTSQTAALRKVRDEMAMELGGVVFFDPNGEDVLDSRAIRRAWLAALDAILQARKKCG